MTQEWSSAPMEVGPVTRAEKAEAEAERLRNDFEELAKSYEGDYYAEMACDEIREILAGTWRRTR